MINVQISNLISVNCFVCLPGEVMFRWIYNDFPNFILPDQRRFVSQTTGNLYIAKVEASDVGNYSCFVSSPTIGKSVFSMPIPLIPQIESECFLITHNTKILLITVLLRALLFLKVNYDLAFHLCPLHRGGEAISC